MKIYEEVEEAVQQAESYNEYTTFEKRKQEFEEMYGDIVDIILTGNGKVKFWLYGEKAPYTTEL